MRRLFSLEIIEMPFHLAFLFVYAIYSYASLLYRKFFPHSLKSLDGEIFLITGSARGIGREVALYLAKYHPKTTLVLWDQNAIDNQEVAEAAKRLGVEAFSYKVDLANRQEVEETSQKVTGEVGNVTILFNNAGVAGIRDLFSMSPEQIEQIIQVNLMSHFWTLREFLPNMLDNNYGHIVTTCSIAGFYATKYDAPYCASKFAIRGYLESIKSELRSHLLKPDNVKFTTIFPVFVRTRLTSRIRLRTKLPFLTQTLDPKYVAQTIIEGIRQNQENVFIPKIFELVILIKSLMPKRLSDMIEDFVVESDSYVREN